MTLIFAKACAYVLSHNHHHRFGKAAAKKQNNVKSYDLADEALDYLSIRPQWEKNGVMLLNTV
jgi:hypothetical protein